VDLPCVARVLPHRRTKRVFIGNLAACVRAVKSDSALPDTSFMPGSQIAKPTLRADTPSRSPRSVGRLLLAWLTDARSHRVVCLVTGLWVLNSFDLVLTVTAYRQGLLHEMNPVAARMLSEGEVFLVLYKFGLLAISSYLLLKLRRERIAELAAMLALIVYAMVAVHWQDCYDVYTQTDISSHNHALLDPLTPLLPD